MESLAIVSQLGRLLLSHPFQSVFILTWLQSAIAVMQLHVTMVDINRFLMCCIGSLGFSSQRELRVLLHLKVLCLISSI